MTIATLPPSNHLQAVRSFIERIRRTRTVPSAQEFAHAGDSLNELEKAIRVAVALNLRQTAGFFPIADPLKEG